MTGWLDLFAGPGGWDLAARRLGLDPVGIEIDPDACATREAAGLRTVHGDVASRGAAALDPGRALLMEQRARAELSGDDEGSVTCDGLIASPPCPTWSSAGHSASEADRELLHRYLQGLVDGDEHPREWYVERCADERSLLMAEPLDWALRLRPRVIACEQVPPALDVWRWTAEILRNLETPKPAEAVA